MVSAKEQRRLRSLRRKQQAQANEILVKAAEEEARKAKAAKDAELEVKRAVVVAQRKAKQQAEMERKEQLDAERAARESAAVEEQARRDLLRTAQEKAASAPVPKPKQSSKRIAKPKRTSKPKRSKSKS